MKVTAKNQPQPNNKVRFRTVLGIFLTLLLPIAVAPALAASLYGDAAAWLMILPGTFMTTLMATGFVLGMRIALSEPEPLETQVAPDRIQRRPNVPPPHSPKTTSKAA